HRLAYKNDVFVIENFDFNNKERLAGSGRNPELLDSLDIGSLKKCFEEYPGMIAAVIMEPMNIAWPEPGFLEEVKEITHQHDAVLIFDETVTGCRFSKGGAQELFNVTPDLATFGKGLANGYPLSAIVGIKEIMVKMEDIFFSGTFSGETASLAAAKVVLSMVRNGEVIETIKQTGEKIIDGVQALISEHKVDEFIQISGHPSWSILTFANAGSNSSWEIKTLFLQEVFKRGILTIGTHNISCAHSDEDVNTLLDTYNEIFPILKDAVVNNTILNQITTIPLEPLFKVR
ncbi:MAG: aminotransferase class III-fold pyridoxal phosphate-dependent enzyme, partial [Candidatus Heimdallarchaeota archaeon]